jgi:hypothetical protein
MISIEKQSFGCNQPQILFLSINVFTHFRSQREPFAIKISSDIQVSCVLECFQNLFNLFSQTTEVEISSSNVHIYQFLAEELDNSSLFNCCQRVNSSNSSFFTLDFTRFSYIHSKTLNLMNNFQLLVNNNSYSLNSSYLACISEKILQQIQNDQTSSSISFSLSEELIPFFERTLKLLRGSQLFIYQNEIGQFLEISNLLEFSLLKEFLFNQIPCPEPFDDCLQFIQKQNAFDFPNHFEQCLSVLSKQFKNIDFEILKRFPTSVLTKIISSPDLKIPDENYLFQTILQLIEIDQQNIILFSNISFSFIEPNLLKEFLVHFEIEDLNQELFEQLKSRLYLPVLVPSESIPTNRYENPPIFFDLKEIKEIFEILDDFFKSSNNRVTNLKNMILENSTMKKEKENIMVPFLSDGRNGIISFLLNKFGSDFIQKNIIISISSTGGGNLRNILT